MSLRAFENLISVIGKLVMSSCGQFNAGKNWVDVLLTVFFCFFFILFLSVTAEVFFERALLREQWQSDVCSAESLMELKFCFFCGRHQSFVASDLLLSLVLRSSNSGVCVGICHLAKTWKVHVYFERARVCMLRLTSHQVGGSGTKTLDPGNDTQQSTLQKRLPHIQSEKYDPILNRNM